METMETINKRGRLIFTNKETGEEQVYTYRDFERLVDAFFLLKEPLTKLCGAQCSCTYRTCRDLLIAATVKTYKWTARIVREEYYREEQAQPPTAEEAYNEAEEAYNKAEEAYNKAEEAYNKAEEAYNEAEETYNEAEETYNKAEETYRAAKEAYRAAKEAYNEKGEAYNEKGETYNKAAKAYRAAAEAYRAAKDEAAEIDPTQLFTSDSIREEE